VLSGNGQANTLDGSSGDDALHGAGGADILIGGLGDDLIDGGLGLDRVLFLGSQAAMVNLSLKVAQNTGYGIDKLTSVENVTSGDGDDSLTGSAVANSLNGGSGTDTIDGGAGNDLLYGSSGVDLLTGGAGLDAFVFDSALGDGNIDTITDFKVADDTIHLSNEIFTALTGGALTAAAFVKNAAGVATDASDRIIYETDTGNLYYDADGTGVIAAVQFATLTPGLAVTSADFLVI